MLERATLIAYLHELLDIDRITDYAPNGLQIEGKNEIKKIITGVTACQALIDAAIKKQADAILVHHGYFWKNESPNLIGIKRERIKTILTHNINLIAYHLPLDVHPEFGNNVILGQRLKLKNLTAKSINQLSGLLYFGDFPEPIPMNEFSQLVNEKLQTDCYILAGTKRPIRTLAWCSGAGQNFTEHAYHLGADAYLTGEVSEYCSHLAQEYQRYFCKAGHHATERYGIQSLGEHIAEHFKIKHEFIDIPNPI